MPILITIAKAGIIAMYGSLLWMLFQFKKQDKGVKIEFDLLSRLELSLGVGLALVGLVSVINPTTYTFTLGLCILSILVGYMHRKRMVVAGDTMVLFKGKAWPIKSIIKLGSGMFTLKIFTKDNQKGYRIYVPLTSNHVLKDRIQAKLSKKK